VPSATERFLAWALAALALILPISIAGTNVALALVTAALLVRVLSGRSLDWDRAWGPAAWCLGLYCAVAVLTSLTGVAPAVSLRNFHKDLHKLWVLLILLPALRAGTGRRPAIALALGFAFIAVYGVFHSCLDSYRSYHGAIFSGYGHTWIRAHAFTHPVTYGEMLALGFLGCLSFLGSPEAQLKERRPKIMLLALLTAGLVLSQTRGAFLGIVAGFVALCVVEPAFRRWLKWGLAAAVLGAVAMELHPSQRSIIASLRNYGTAAGANPQLHRFILWDVAWRIFKDHPWLGVGPANYATVFTRYFQGMIEGIPIWGSAHNIFLQQLAERGLAGLATLLALCWVFLTRAWRRVRLVSDAWTLWALAATVCFLVMNLTESAFQNEQITTLFLFIWAGAETRSTPAPRRQGGLES
jgi:O-antigen ligase